jgi:hypothetical protein
MKNPPMRMVILLAVLWGAGSWLLAAESPSAPKPAAAAKQTDEAPKAEQKTEQTTEQAAGQKAEGESKTDTAPSKGSIADQAEAALKAAAEADPAGASSEPSKSDTEDANQQAKDDTQRSPTGGAGKGPSPQRFVPSEQVRADFDVSFPIDI